MVFTYARDEDGLYICPHCGDKKRLPSTMNMHRRKCEGDLGHECSSCDYKCLSRGRLELHIAAKHPQAGGKKIALLKCPIDGCTFQTLAAGNRLIHFVRKHCSAEVAHILDEDGMTCKACDKEFQSNTAFQYHAAHCITLRDEVKSRHLTSLIA